MHARAPSTTANRPIGPTPRLGRNVIVLLFAAATLVAGLAACTSRIEQRGNSIDPDILRRIEPGVSDRAGVRDMLGSPSSQATFGGETWYYISARKEYVAFYAPKTIDQQVVAIEFDDAGLVTSVRYYDSDHAIEVDPVDAATPTGGRKLTILDQLLGGVGRLGQRGTEN